MAVTRIIAGVRRSIPGFADHSTLSVGTCSECGAPPGDHRRSDQACPLRYIVARIETLLGRVLTDEEIADINERGNVALNVRRLAKATQEASPLDA